MTRVECISRAVQIDLGLGGKVHWRRIDGNSDIAEAAVRIACGDVHAATKGDGQMDEVPAEADLLLMSLRRGPRGPREAIAEGQAIVNAVHDRLHPRPAGRHLPEQLPARTHQLVGFAISAAQQIAQDIVRKFVDRRLAGDFLFFVIFTRRLCRCLKLSAEKRYLRANRQTPS